MWYMLHRPPQRVHGIICWNCGIPWLSISGGVVQGLPLSCTGGATGSQLASFHSLFVIAGVFRSQWSIFLTFYLLSSGNLVLCRVSTRLWAATRSSMKKAVFARMYVILFCVYFETHRILFRLFEIWVYKVVPHELYAICGNGRIELNNNIGNF